MLQSTGKKTLDVTSSYFDALPTTSVTYTASNKPNVITKRDGDVIWTKTFSYDASGRWIGDTGWVPQ